MQKPEDNIDPSLLDAFKKEKNWLNSYFQQLSTSQRPIPQIIESAISLTPTISAKSQLPKEFLIFSKEITHLKSSIQEKHSKIEDLNIKILNQEVNFESWKKLKQLENDELASKLQKSEESNKNLVGQLEFLKGDQASQIENKEHQMLTTKISLLEVEIKGHKQIITEKNQQILELQEQLTASEEKIRSISEYYKSKEQTIRQEIENSYSYIEMQQKIDYYSKKMKEFQHKFLEIKSYEDHMLKILERNQELEQKSEDDEQKILQYSTAYTKLKQDYGFLSQKLKNDSESLKSCQNDLEMQRNKSSDLERENFYLRRDLVELAEKQNETSLFYSTVEEVIIKNTQLNGKLDEVTRINEKLESENLELKRRIHTFEQPKAVPLIEFEEIPDFECDLPATREQFLQALTMKNERLMAEVEYLSEKLKLAQLKFDNLSEENNKLDLIVKDLTEKFISLQCVDFSNLNNEHFTDQIKILEAKLQVSEKISEKYCGENAKMKESLQGLTEYCKKLEKSLAEGLMEMKNEQDFFINNAEMKNSEYLEMRKKYCELEEGLRVRCQELEDEIEVVKKLNCELEVKVEERNKEIRERNEELRAKTDIESELYLKSENLKNGLIGQIDKLTLLIYKSLNRPIDVEDARASQ